MRAAECEHLVRTMFAAWNERRQTETLPLFDEDVVLDARDLPQPDFSGVYRGLEEYLRWAATWLSAWEHIAQVPLWFAAEDDRVIAWIRFEAIGKRSGIAGDGFGGWDFTFRDGRVSYIRLIIDEDEARHALETPPPSVDESEEARPRADRRYLTRVRPPE